MDVDSFLTFSLNNKKSTVTEKGVQWPLEATRSEIGVRPVHKSLENVLKWEKWRVHTWLHCQLSPDGKSDLKIELRSLTAP